MIHTNISRRNFPSVLCLEKNSIFNTKFQKYIAYTLCTLVFFKICIIIMYIKHPEWTGIEKKLKYNDKAFFVLHTRFDKQRWCFLRHREISIHEYGINHEFRLISISKFKGHQKCLSHSEILNTQHVCSLLYKFVNFTIWFTNRVCNQSKKALGHQLIRIYEGKKVE